VLGKSIEFLAEGILRPTGGARRHGAGGV